MDETQTSKVCQDCKLSKALEEFPNCSKAKDGKHRRCKKCKWAYEKAYREGRKATYNEEQRRWRANNPERYKEIQTNWRRDNPERNREIHNDSWQRHRSGLTGDSITLQELYERDGGICKLCGEPCVIEAGQIEHATPISRGGTHTWDNVQLAHALCNQRKGTKTMEEWNNQRRHWNHARHEGKSNG